MLWNSTQMTREIRKKLEKFFETQAPEIEKKVDEKRKKHNFLKAERRAGRQKGGERRFQRSKH